MQSDETNTKRITVRVPTDLADDYDEAVGNRSEAIRAHMRQAINRPESEGRQPPQDDDALRKGYKTLLAVCGDGKAIPVREAKSLIASKTNISADLVSLRVLTPLRNRGYIRRTGDPYQDQWIAIRDDTPSITVDRSDAWAAGCETCGWFETHDDLTDARNAKTDHADNSNHPQAQHGLRETVRTQVDAAEGES